MKMAAFDYHRPSSLDEALDLLAAHGDDGKILAGGQSLLAVMAMRLSSPGHLIDIGAVSGLNDVVTADDHVTVGSLVRQSTAEASVAVAAGTPMVSKALPFIGHRAIRNRGTICGSLAHADPAAELPCVALALDAELTVRSATATRTVAAADFFQGFLTTTISEDEMLTQVRFPRWSGRSGFAVQEISRRHGDFAVVGTTVGLGFDDAGVIARAAIALFGVASTPVRMPAAERLLVGHKADAAAFAAAAAAVSAALDPPSDDHATSAYRRHVAGVLTRRSLQAATDDAGARQ
jgi:aerobic carbon-monoxide dehydrogenase medium subunit